ncbi:hypothetical protein AB9F34_33760, partial [Rhizobium leguminosarum]|uniref:hypothetical protein n=1 Tax=Rhizobium leguminosarum TaxID=384 RepID=UPI003F94CD3D
TNINGATPQAIENRTDTAYWFWSAVKEISGFCEPLAREKTVAAQPVVLNAIAKLVFDFSFSNRRPEDGDDLTERSMSARDDSNLSV